MMRRLLIVLLALASWAGCQRAGADPLDRVPQKNPPDAIRLVTWNVLADPADAETRGPALLAELEASDADVIALQEVAPWFERLLDGARWTEAYNRVPDDGAFAGLLILTRHDVTRTSHGHLPSQQRRGYLRTTLDVDGIALDVVTVHLDSPLEVGAVRAEQLETVFAHLDGADHAVVLGDFNFGETEQPETDTIPSTWVDVWTALENGDGHTWDMSNNPMAVEGAFEGEHSRRLDRVLLRSTTLEPASIRRLGTRAVSDGVFPSDHYGLSATVEVTND